MFLEIKKIFAPIEQNVVAVLRYLGDFWNFTHATFFWMARPPFRWPLFVRQFNVVGVESLPIIILVSLFTGMVFALQTTYAFRLFSAETLVGSTVGLSLAREIAPVFAGIMVTARVGSAMAAELGTMKVTEQVDALDVMAVNPHQYLVVPRVLAASLIVPLQTVIFNFVGILGAYLIGVCLLGIPEGPFFQRLYQFVEPKDILGGVVKAIFFGFMLASLSCFEGFRTKQGARGVGISTTRAVVISCVVILVMDYFLTQVILEVLHD